jgi:hypothetical protein
MEPENSISEKNESQKKSIFELLNKGIAVD